MKKKVERKSCVRMKKPFLFAVLFIALLHISSYSQVYYSSFESPDNNYQTSTPSGVLCLFPTFTNASSIADNNLDNYSSVTGLASLAVICSNTEYSIRAKIALPNGMTEVPAGYYAGFKLRFNSILSLSLLQSNLRLRTYLGGQEKETTSGSGLLGLSLLATSTEATNVSFLTTQPFDEVEIILNTSGISLDVGFDYQFFYSYASTSTILPVKLTSFSALAQEKQVFLNWANASEVNVARYEVERSNDGGVRFATIGTVGAKGVADYSYIDASVWDGNYIYRLKMVDKDGSVEYSQLASVRFVSTAKWKIYPTLLSSGTAININLTDRSNTKMQIQLVSTQGQVVRTVAAGSNMLSMPTNNLSAGMYILKLYQNGRFVASEKVSIQ